MAKLFSIILLHYKQKQFIREALDSVFCQNYSNIELIVCDDGTSGGIEDIKKYISKNKTPNVKNVKYVINEENKGTVRTTNEALKKVDGEYVLIFAADDNLYDNKTISNFAKEFDKNPEFNIITSQCILYDDNLKKEFGKYVDEKRAILLNEASSIDQYKTLTKTCLYAAGSTAYKTKLFIDNNYIDEDYKLVEDLTFWLKLTRNGEKFYYADFTSLKHRNGGVSKKDERERVSSSQKKYYDDLVLMKEKEILAYLSLFNEKEKKEVLNDYRNFLYFVSLKNPDSKKLYSKKNKEILLKNPKYVVSIIGRKFINLLKIIYKHLSFVIWLLLIWLISSLFEKNIIIGILIVLAYYVARISKRVIYMIWRKYGKK